MRARLLAAIAVCAVLSSSAGATTTWSQETAFPLVSKLVATTGTETGNLPTASTAGLSLSEVRGFTVHVEAAAAMTAGGTLLAYMWNPVTERWNRVADGSLDLVVSAVQYQTFSGFEVTGNSPQRIAYVPSGIGQASTIWIFGSR